MTGVIRDRSTLAIAGSSLVRALKQQKLKRRERLVQVGAVDRYYYLKPTSGADNGLGNRKTLRERVPVQNVINDCIVPGHTLFLVQ